MTETNKDEQFVSSVKSAQRRIKLLELRQVEQNLMKQLEQSQIYDSPKYISRLETLSDKSFGGIVLARMAARLEDLEKRLTTVEDKVIEKEAKELEDAKGEALRKEPCLQNDFLSTAGGGTVDWDSLISLSAENQPVHAGLHSGPVEMCSPRGEVWWKQRNSQLWTRLMAPESAWEPICSRPIILPASLGQGKINLFFWRCAPVKQPAKSTTGDHLGGGTKNSVVQSPEKSYVKLMTPVDSPEMKKSMSVNSTEIQKSNIPALKTFVSPARRNSKKMEHSSVIPKTRNFLLALVLYAPTGDSENSYNARVLAPQLPLSLEIKVKAFAVTGSAGLTEGKGVVRLEMLGLWPGHTICVFDPKLYDPLEPPLLQFQFSRPS